MCGAFFFPEELPSLSVVVSEPHLSTPRTRSLVNFTRKVPCVGYELEERTSVRSKGFGEELSEALFCLLFFKGIRMTQRYQLAPRVRVVTVSDVPGLPYLGRAIREPDDVWRPLREEVSEWDRERFLVLALDGRHRALGLEEVSVGTATASLVHPREVFKGLVLANACAFVLIHNHPSGDPAPSQEDRDVTRRLKEAGALFGIPLLDHVIVAAGRFFSFSRAGEL